ncbi:hypothetical protein [Moritella sp. Urea-trap-13]|uniref:hypothetical protein n=1 Tax=Moritella sp. Urea-trap-13 TaxID=2058327 RepID=UPI0012FF2381|nr:hypothetical protein [Moritella sp. Urea-trap-13]
MQLILQLTGFTVILNFSVYANDSALVSTLAEHVEVQGHLKFSGALSDTDKTSVYDAIGYSELKDADSDARFNIDGYWGPWQMELDYQLLLTYGDIQALRHAPLGVYLGSKPINDDKRLFNLTQTFVDDEKLALTQRLDRVSVNYSKDALVLKIGRQAISWGNGLVYTPMDLFNPFDPALIDTEYKTGDDMVYSQYLFDSGNDVQLVWVVRRDEHGNVTDDVDSSAIKYHFFQAQSEWDLLIANHYRDQIVAISNVTNVAGTVLSSDVVYTYLDTDNVVSAVLNASYSWVLLDKNMFAFVEYFYNGFGQKNGDYSPGALAGNPALWQRLERGELYTLGQRYVTTSVNIEMTPLWMFTPNVLINLSDTSALLQLISSHNLTQNTQLTMVFSVPIGPDGTEYGGVTVTQYGEPKYLSTEWTFFAELAWYF